MVSQNQNQSNKPVLFGHDCISKNDTSHKLAQSISNTIIKIIQLDKEIKPDDIAIIMKKSNSNYVFEHIKNILPKLYKKYNIQHNLNIQMENIQTENINSQLVHFETSGDGYSNSINWDKAKNKTVLISIHGDKGKGHKVVFFLGLSKKSIPSDYNIGRDFELVDISLLNVALTRSLKYLFIGFTFVSPSVYLSNKHLEFDKYCYLAWDKDIYAKLEKQDLNVYSESIKELNKYWFDSLKSNLKNPNFIIGDNIDAYSKLPIKLNINVSQDISKDMVGFIEQIIPNIIIEEDCVDLYEPVNLNGIPESFYKIFGFVGELLLMRLNMIEEKNFGVFGWILGLDIYYTDFDSFLNIIYDYKLNNYINDLGCWKDKVIEIQFESILNDKNEDIMDLMLELELSTKPKFILNQFYKKYNIEQFIIEFCSDISNKDFCFAQPDNINKIIIIAMILSEFNCEIRRDFIYSVVESVLKFSELGKIINQIISNVQYVWDNLIKSNKINLIQFQKNISIEKKIKNKNILKYYGFNYKTDKSIYKNGLKIGIGGICDLIVSDESGNNTNLFELRTGLKTSFSNEWVLQIIVYNILIGIVDQTKIQSNWIINLFDGSIYKINFKSDIQIIKNILKLYDFDDYLINHILTNS